MIKVNLKPLTLIISFPLIKSTNHCIKVNTLQDIIMTIKKNKLVLSLAATLFLSLPMSQAFAHEDHCEIKDTELGDIMKYMKSELRAYNKGFNSEDQAEMKEHANELLKLSAKAEQLTPVVISNASHHDADNKGEVSADQKVKYSLYQKEMQDLHATFKALSETNDEAEIEILLAKVKKQQKQGHNAFRQNCK